MHEGIELWEKLSPEREAELHLQLAKLKEAFSTIDQLRIEEGSYSAALAKEVSGTRPRTTFRTHFLQETFGEYIRFLQVLIIELATPFVVAGLKDEMPPIHPEDARTIIDISLAPKLHQSPVEKQHHQLTVKLVRQLFNIQENQAP